MATTSKQKNANKPAEIKESINEVCQSKLKRCKIPLCTNAHKNQKAMYSQMIVKVGYLIVFFR